MKTNMTQIKGERMDKNVYAAIQSQYATFSKVGKRIADHIIADPVHITSISIQQMAAELHRRIEYYSILQDPRLRRVQRNEAAPREIFPQVGSNNIRRFV